MRRNAGTPDPRAEKLKRRLSRHSETGKSHGSERIVSHLHVRVIAVSTLLRNVAFLVVLAAILVYLWRAVQDNSIYVESISVPPTLADRGITSSLITNRVVDRIGRMARDVRESSNQADAPEVRSLADIPEFRVFTFGPTLQSLGRQVRSAVGKSDTRIAGSVTRNETAWYVTARNAETHVVAAMEVPDVEPLAEVIAEAAAIAVLRVGSPRTLMSYQYATYKRLLDPVALNSLESTLNFRENVAGASEDREIRYMRAVLTFERGDFGSAREAFLRLAHDYPGWTKVKSMAAMAATASGRQNEANALLNEIILSTETHPSTLASVAETLRNLGRARDALELAARSMQSDPSYENARILAADILNTLHRPNEAIRLLDNWKPTSVRNQVWVYGVLGESYRMQGELSLLQEVRERLARQFPNDLQSLNVAGMEAELRGDWSVARGLYQGLATRDPGSGLEVAVARVLLKEGNAAAATPILEQFLRTMPADVEGRFLLGRAHAMSGQFAAAGTDYEGVIALDQDHVEALKEWSDALMRLGRRDESHGKAILAREAAKRLAVPLNVPIPRRP